MNKHNITVKKQLGTLHWEKLVIRLNIYGLCCMAMAIMLVIL